MGRRLCILLALVCSTILASAQTAEELVAKNLQAKGGLDKIMAIKSLRMTGTVETPDQIFATMGVDSKSPDRVRQSFTLQGMSQILVYDGSTAWWINPFNGKKDPTLMGEDQARGLIEDADFYGPLVDAAKKGNTIEYVGHATIDGDDAYQLRVTLKNGDILYYYLDPDTYLEIRTEKHELIRGSVRESIQNLGSYKLVNGVYFPFDIESGPKNSPDLDKITVEKIEANIDIPDSEFKMPAAPAAASPQKADAPAQKKPPQPRAAGAQHQ
jgi:outer membrane lipoprotein-sorting protein